MIKTIATVAAAVLVFVAAVTTVIVGLPVLLDAIGDTTVLLVPTFGFLLLVVGVTGRAAGKALAQH